MRTALKPVRALAARLVAEENPGGTGHEESALEATRPASTPKEPVSHCRRRNRFSSGASAFLLALAMLVGATEAEATVFKVPTGDGVLQAAIAFTQPGDELWVERGTHYLSGDRTATFTLKSGVKLYGGFAGNETSLDQRDTARNATILSGDIGQNDATGGDNSENAYHVVTADGVDATTILDGFTITGGNADGEGEYLFGAGLFGNEDSSPTIRNCSFQGNHSKNNGAAIYIRSPTSSPTTSSPTFSNCTIQGNFSDFGSVINFALETSPTLINCTIQGNAVGNNFLNYIIWGSDSASLTLINCIVWGNSSNSVALKVNSGRSTFSHCLIEGWTATELDALGNGGSNNLDGTDPANDPLFAKPIDPATAPSTGGSLRLLPGSPAYNAGLTSANSLPTDLSGRSRIFDSTIDLGAYELQPDFFVDANAPAYGDGRSWATAFRYLRDAFRAVNRTASQHAIFWVAGGTYYPDDGAGISPGDRTATFHLQSGVAIYGGFPSGGGPRDRDLAVHRTTLSGDISGFSADSLNVLTAGALVDDTAILDGFIISGGNANFPGYRESGGGLYCQFGASPSISNCTFQGNSASEGGGAIYNEGSSSPTLTNCVFQGNSASEGGGAIFNYRDASPTLTNCVFQGNAAAWGGAIYNHERSSPVLINCTFQGNHAHSTTVAQKGGAILNAIDCHPELTNCIIWNNAEGNATTTDGASVGNNPDSFPIYSHCLIQNFSASELDDAGGTGNLDGDDADNDPLFFTEVAPTSAPTTLGDLRLRAGSPVRDAGLDGANPTSTDLAGTPRVVGRAIDLGAYEAKIIFRVTADPNLGHTTGPEWTWNAPANLQFALQHAVDGDEIWLKEGVYYPDEGYGQRDNAPGATFRIPDGVALYGRFAGNETRLSGREQDVLANRTILSGDLDKDDDSGEGITFSASEIVDENAYTVVTMDARGTYATPTRLDGLIITGGDAQGTNTASETRGGGVYINASGTADHPAPVLAQCRLLGNRAKNTGGGAYLHSYGELEIVNCDFRGNEATRGGGAYWYLSTVRVAHSSFSGNLATKDNGEGDGGAVYDDQGTSQYLHCTMTGNRADRLGGALRNAGSEHLTIANSIIWNNEASHASSTENASLNLSDNVVFRHCLIENFDLSNGNLDGTAPENAPLFRDTLHPQRAPSALGDFRLLPESPAVDRGNNALLDGTISQDVLGRDRLFNDGTVDLGAIETQLSTGRVYHVTWNAGIAPNQGAGESWTNPIDLQGALAGATAGDELWLKEGVYYPDRGTGQTKNERGSTFHIPDGVRLYGGFEGDESARHQRYPEHYPTVLSGDLAGDDVNTAGVVLNSDDIRGDNNAYNVVYLGSQGEYGVLLDGLTVTAGRATGNTPLRGTGGGIQGGFQSVRLINCRIVGNQANEGGGYVKYGRHDRFGRRGLHFETCTFEGNGSDNRGGAVFLHGTETGNEVATIIGRTPARIDRCQFVGNSAVEAGGAIYFKGVSSRGDRHVPAAYQVEVTNTSFTGNTSKLGGAVIVEDSSPTFVNTTFTGNNATVRGGAFSVGNGNPHFYNTVIWNNRSIIAQEASFGEEGDANPSPVFKHCLIENFTDTALDFRGEESEGNLNGQDSANDPQFAWPADPADAPTRDGDVRLLSDSPLRDAGNDDLNLTSRDLLGRDRLRDTAIDIGATENGSLHPSPSSTTLSYTGQQNSTLSQAFDLTTVFVLDGADEVLSVDVLSSNHPDVVTGTARSLHIAVENGNDYYDFTGEINLHFHNSTGTATLKMLLHTFTASATYTLTVESLEARHYVASDASSGAGDGSSWSDAFTTLQDALDRAQTGDSIWVKAGVYRPDEGAGQPADDRDATFALDADIHLYGGFDGTEDTFDERNDDPAANLTVLSGDLLGNDASDGVTTNPTGPNGDDNAYSVVTITNAAATLDGFTITGGRAEDSSIEQRQDPDSSGGAVFVDTISSKMPTIRNCRLIGNLAYQGGALFINKYGSCEIINCDFRSNQATQRGGAAYYWWSDVTTTNCNFSGNQSDEGGGAIYDDPQDIGSSKYVNCTFTGNHAVESTGGAIDNATHSNTASMHNTLIWNNRDSGGADTETASVGRPDNYVFHNCLVQNSDLTSRGRNNFNGSLSNNDPLFVDAVDPADAPTAHGDLRLQAGSPALDRGDNTVATAVDLAGNERIVHGTVDLGAYEHHYGLLLVDVDTPAIADAQDGLTWATAFQHLQDALARSSSGTTIHVAAGTYYPNLGENQSNDDRDATFKLQSGVALYGGYPIGGNGNRDPTTHPTILSGDLAGDDNDTGGSNSENAFHVLTANGVDTTAILDGFTISGGNADEPVDNDVGGGLHCVGASPTLTNCSFVGNESSLKGGAIYNNSSSPKITDCSFRNSLAEVEGGAIFNRSSSPEITNCTFQGNVAYEGGAAIFNYRSSSPEITNCTFQGSSDSGVYNEQSSPEFTNCTFRGNENPAIFNYDSSHLTLINCIIWNDAAGNNGALVIPDSYNSSTTFSHCLVQDRNAADLNDPGNSLDGTADANGHYANAPLFVDETSGDLRLQASSPAIDQGFNGDLGGLDLAGNPRIVNGIIDLGAYEHAYRGQIYRVASDASSGGDGRTWATAFQHLQDALGAARGGDEIWVKQGVYYPNLDIGQTMDDRTATFALKSDVALYGGFVGTETSLGDRPTDTANAPTILSGDLARNDDTGDTGTFGENAYHVLTADHVDETAILDGFTISGGNANGLYGNGYGGGLHCLLYASPSLSNCSFRGNRASNGGAISISHLNIPFGGAVFISHSGPSLTNCFFQGNEASVEGGAIYHDRPQQAIVEFVPPPTFANCVFFKNICNNIDPDLSDQPGGAFFGAFSNAVFTNCSFVNNSGSQLYLEVPESPVPTFNNCIIWGTGTGNAIEENAPTPNGQGIVISIVFKYEDGNENGIVGANFHNCLIQGRTSGELDIRGSNNLSSDNDPLFVNVASGNLRLQPGSPAIDQGNNNAANVTSLDLAGNVRKQGLAIDLGAYESSDAYDTWISGFFSGETDSEIIGRHADPNDDGWPNVMAFVLASSPVAYLEDYLPTQTMDDTYVIIEFGRYDLAAYLNPRIRYSTDMVHWRTAVDRQHGIRIQVVNDGVGPGIDRVTVKIPHADKGSRIFYQLFIDNS